MQTFDEFVITMLPRCCIIVGAVMAFGTVEDDVVVEFKFGMEFLRLNTLPMLN